MGPIAEPVEWLASEGSRGLTEVQIERSLEPANNRIGSGFNSVGEPIPLLSLVPISTPTPTYLGRLLEPLATIQKLIVLF